MEKSAMTTVLITAIIALMVGGGVGYAVSNNMDEGSKSNDSAMIVSNENISVKAPAANLRVALNNALREHVDLAGVALRNIYTQSPDKDAAVAALDENSVEVADTVGSVYGPEARDGFLVLWRDHIGYFADYTVASRDNDQAGMDKALEELVGYGEKSSDFFAKANPNLPKSAVMPLLKAHRDAVILVIDDIDAGNFNKAYSDLNKAADQVSEVADALAGGIEAQYPDKY